MSGSKFRKLITNKILLIPFVLICIVTGTLALIPHSSCACGDNKREISLLRLVVEAAIHDLKRIF